MLWEWKIKFKYNINIRHSIRSLAFCHSLEKTKNNEKCKLKKNFHDNFTNGMAISSVCCVWWESWLSPIAILQKKMIYLCNENWILGSVQLYWLLAQRQKFLMQLTYFDMQSATIQYLYLSIVQCKKWLNRIETAIHCDSSENGKQNWKKVNTIELYIC